MKLKKIINIFNLNIIRYMNPTYLVETGIVNEVTKKNILNIYYN